MENCSDSRHPFYIQSNKLNIKRFQENDNWSMLIKEMLGFETGEEYDKVC